MNTNASQQLTPLRGIIPPMVTPLLDHETLDIAGLEQLVEHILGGGVHGLFILGTTGEAPSLGHAIRYPLIDRVCDQVAGRVPVLVGITDTSLVESLRLAERAYAAGAAAVVASAPFYFPIDQSHLLRYVEQLVERLPLPLIIYNIPVCTRIVFEPETVVKCSQLPGVIGLKDSSGDLPAFESIVKAMKDRPEFSLLVGVEQMLAEAVALGAHGGICGGANLHPQLFVELYDAAVAGDALRVEQLQSSVMSISESIYSVAAGMPGAITSLKCALQCLGVIQDAMAPPLEAFGEELREKIRAAVKQLDIPLQPTTVTEELAPGASLRADGSPPRA